MKLRDILNGAPPQRIEMQLEHNHTMGMDKNNKGPQTARPRKQKGARHKATIRISHAGFSSSLESDSKWWILAMTFVQGIFAVLIILGAIFLYKLF